MRETYSEAIIEYLLTGKQPKEEDAWWEIFAFTGEKETAAWEDLRDELLPAWVEERPGSRPWGWWKHDAPKAKAPEIPAWHLSEMVEPRKQLGGTGAPSWEKYPAILAYYTRGIPDSWEGIDPNDPPVVESEAAYLKRHKLFVNGEERRLTEADFQPEVVR
jgi:hypothetical protein